MWRDLGAAFALMLVLEGILPFLNPAGLRRMVASINELSDGQLRAVGLISMAGGAGLLYILR